MKDLNYYIKIGKDFGLFGENLIELINQQREEDRRHEKAENERLAAEANSAREHEINILKLRLRYYQDPNNRGGRNKRGGRKIV